MTGTSSRDPGAGSAGYLDSLSSAERGWLYAQTSASEPIASGSAAPGAPGGDQTARRARGKQAPTSPSSSTASSAGTPLSPLLKRDLSQLSPEEVEVLVRERDRLVAALARRQASRRSGKRSSSRADAGEAEGRRAQGRVGTLAAETAQDSDLLALLAAKSPAGVTVREQTMEQASQNLHARAASLQAQVDQLNAESDEAQRLWRRQLDDLRHRLSQAELSDRDARQRLSLTVQQRDAAVQRLEQMERGMVRMRTAFLTDSHQDDRHPVRQTLAEQRFWDQLTTPEVLARSEPPTGFPIPDMPGLLGKEPHVNDVASELNQMRRKLKQAVDERNAHASATAAAQKQLSERVALHQRERRWLSDKLTRQQTKLIGAVRRINWLVEQQKQHEAKEKDTSAYIERLESKLIATVAQVRQLQRGRPHRDDRRSEGGRYSYWSVPASAAGPASMATTTVGAAAAAAATTTTTTTTVADSDAATRSRLRTRSAEGRAPRRREQARSVTAMSPVVEKQRGKGRANKHAGASRAADSLALPEETPQPRARAVNRPVPPLTSPIGRPPRLAVLSPSPSASTLPKTPQSARSLALSDDESFTVSDIEAYTRDMMQNMPTPGDLASPR